MTSVDLQARLDAVAAMSAESRQVLLGSLVTIVTADQWEQALESARRVEVRVTYGPRIPAAENDLHKFEIPHVSGPQG